MGIFDNGLTFKKPLRKNSFKEIHDHIHRKLKCPHCHKKGFLKIRGATMAGKSGRLYHIYTVVCNNTFCTQPPFSVYYDATHWKNMDRVAKACKELADKRGEPDALIQLSSLSIPKSQG